MANRNLVLVTIPTILSLLLLVQAAASYSSQRSIYTSAYGSSNVHLENLFKNSSKSWHQEWLVKAATPSYLQDFFKLADKAFNKSATSTDTTEEDFRNFLELLFDGVTSDSCKGHVTEWFWRWQDMKSLFGEKDKWVLQMIDAWGKLPEGILSGHVNSYGDFHECVQIDVTDLEILNNIYSKEKIEKSFKGQYCSSYLLGYEDAMGAIPEEEATRMRTKRVQNGIQESVSVEEFLRMLFNQVPTSVMLIPSIAVCLPNSCSMPDVQQILINGLSMLYRPPLNPESLPWPVTTVCVDDNKPKMDAAVIIVIILVATLIILALGAGILDYWYDNTEWATPPSSTAYQYLMAFSLYTNIKKWSSTRRSADDLGCLHGIRFFSTCWVLLAHTIAAFAIGPQWNMIDIMKANEDWTILAVLNGTFSVDTFFVMSGMLVTYSILKMLDKTKGKFNVVMFYVHRYIRITPMYAILVGITATLLTYTSNGPVWFYVQWNEDNCRKNWWTNILYVNNIVNTKAMCKVESWYLANDMQFYILSPLIVYPIWKWEKVGMGLLSVYTVLSCMSQVFVIAFANGAPAAIVATGDNTHTESHNEIYYRPWSRIAPFLIGVWLGWLLHKTRGKRVRIPRPLVAVLWACSTGVAMSIVFGIHDWFDSHNKIPKVAGYFYGGLSRASFGLSISWVIFACVKGYGGIINKFLSWKAFMPLGRLCFCVYLASTHLQDIFHSRLAVPIKWDKYTAVNIYFAHVVMSFIAGFFCTLLFESPFIILQKLIFEGSGAKPEPKKLVTASGDDAIASKVVDIEEVANNNNNNDNNNDDSEKPIKIDNE